MNTRNQSSSTASPTPLVVRTIGLSSVTERAFVLARKKGWDELESLVSAQEQGGKRARLPATTLGTLSPLYRNAAADLARTQSSAYSTELTLYLQGLTARAHAVLYRKAGRREQLREQNDRTSWLVIFPRTLRKHKWPMILAFALFFGPLFIGLFASLADPDFAHRIAGEAELRQLAEGYAKGFSDGRGDGEGALMAGFYVNNNVGIALRCFAVGIFGGIGSAFYLLHNGLTIGATLGYVAHQGAGGNLFTFIIGHGSFELGAIVIAGGAGMALGWAVVAPGELTRIASLRKIAKDVVIIMAGAAIMLFIAAGLEAFWSASSLPNLVKLITGAVFFVGLSVYVLFAGRRANTTRLEVP